MKIRRALVPLFALAAVASAGESDQVPAWAEEFRAQYLAAKASGTLTLNVRATQPVPPGRSEVYALVDVQAMAFPAGESPPANVALVLDHSMSMKGSRLEAVKLAAKDVIATLGEKDRLAIIRTSTGVETFRSVPVTAENRVKMNAFIDEMKASGSSDISIGFDNAVEQLDEARAQFQQNDVVLVSDGRLTHGMNDPAGLAGLAKEVRTEKKIHVSAVAIGEDCDQELMQGIAKEGWGFFDYLSDAARLPRIGKHLRLAFVRRAAENARLSLRVPSDNALEDVFGFDEFHDPETINIPFRDIGVGERLPVVLRFLVNAARGKDSAYVASVTLEYDDGLTETHRTSSLPIQVAVGGGKATDVTVQTFLTGASALARRNAIWAQGTFLEGDKRAAMSMLSDTATALRHTATQFGKPNLDDALKPLQRMRDMLEPPKKPARRPKRR